MARTTRRSRRRRSATKPEETTEAYKEALAQAATHEYRKFRETILQRDDHRCQMCGRRARLLDVHHIERKKDKPELVMVASNVIALCRKCHRTHVTGNERRYAYIFRTLLALRGYGG